MDASGSSSLTKKYFLRLNAHLPAHRSPHPSVATKLIMDASMESDASFHDRRRSFPCSNVPDTSNEGRNVIVQDQAWGGGTPRMGLVWNSEMLSHAFQNTAVHKTNLRRAVSHKGS